MSKKSLFETAQPLNLSQQNAVRGGGSRHHDHGDSRHHDKGDSRHHDIGDSRHHDVGDSRRSDSSM